MPNRASVLLAATLFCCFIGGVRAQSDHPIMDKIAEKVIEKYKNTSCQQLAAQRGKPKTGKREAIVERVVRMLREDAELRKAFLEKVAAPIADKLLECELIP